MPLDSPQETQSLLAFWRAIESLTPQKLERADPKSADAPVYAIDTTDAVFPWHDPAHRRKKIPANKAWRYTLQAGRYDIDALTQLLQDKIGAHADVFDDGRSNGQSRLFDLGFDNKGYPLPETFVLSLACWSAGQILNFEDGMAALEEGGRVEVDDLPAPDQDTPRVDSGYSGFDALSQGIVMWLSQAEAKMRENGSPPQRPWLDRVTRRLAAKVYLPNDLLGENIVSSASCWQVPNKKADAPRPGATRIPAAAPEPSMSRDNGFSGVNDEGHPETPMVKSASTTTSRTHRKSTSSTVFSSAISAPCITP